MKKLKEEGENTFNQFDERITNMERKSWTWTKNMSIEVKITKKEHVGENQGKTVITGFHSETTESEVTQLLKEMIN